MIRKMDGNDKQLISLLFLIQIISVVVAASDTSAAIIDLLFFIFFVICSVWIGVVFVRLKYQNVKKGLASLLYGLWVAAATLFAEASILVIATGIDGRPADSFNLFDKPILYNLFNGSVIFVAMCLPSLAIIFIYFDLKKSISKSQKQ